jgi:hypothetical protein
MEGPKGWEQGDRKIPIQPGCDSDDFTVDDQGNVTFNAIQYYEHLQGSSGDWPSYCYGMEMVKKFGMSEEMADRMHPGEAERAWLQFRFPQFNWDQVSMWWDT